MDERDFYTERPESKAVEYTCPRCKRSNQYQVRWIRRTKKDRLPPRADERDRALYAKLRDYLIRVDDDVTCKTCQKRFEILPIRQRSFLTSAVPGGPAGTMTTTIEAIAPDRAACDREQVQSNGFGRIVSTLEFFQHSLSQNSCTVCSVPRRPFAQRTFFSSQLMKYLAIS